MKDRILDISASALSSNEAQYDALITNLVSSRTAGYKESHFVLSTFAEVLSQIEKNQASSKVAAKNLYTDFSQGTILQTNLPLDFAITGSGFFVLQTPDGLMFTRDGRFRINSLGQLVSLSKGFPVLSEGGQIVFDPSVNMQEITVSLEGEIFVGYRRIEKFKLIAVENEKDLQSFGGTFFKPNKIDLPLKNDFDYQIKQGFVELSNVDTMQAMLEMMILSRVEGINAKAVNTRDAMLSKTMELGAPPK